MKKIEDYLHLYLGCECKMTKPSYHAVHELHLSADRHFVLTGKLLHYFIDGTTKAEIKPILRNLSDMTEEEMKECGNMVYDFSDEEDLNKWNWKDFHLLAPEQFMWLLSKHFDLFNLIPEGLALDATTLTPLTLPGE